MIRQSFNNDWQVKLQGSDTPAQPVTLPHDAMIGQKRRNDGTTSRDKAFFPNGVWEYAKTFSIPAEYKSRHITLEFEGVYNRSQVFINDTYAGGRPYGYSEFYVDLDSFLNYGTKNTIKVIAHSADDSRWYTGAGIYRPVSLLTSGQVYIPPNGVRISTPEISPDCALVVVETSIRNVSANSRTRLYLYTAIYDKDGVLAGEDSMPLTALKNEDSNVRQRIFVKGAKRWEPDTPCLYTCKSRIMEGDETLDSEETIFGVRSLSLDRENGLSVNGKTVKLRGACIHHDNGVIGAATIERAEERRVEKLKEAGFNAIRSAHHPASRALLNACDRLGMFVMDETFDSWTESKRPFDYALDFPEWWEKDVEAMIAKDFNHPSVIIYSIGNEINECCTPDGGIRGRRIAGKVRALDGTRYTTCAVNTFLAIMENPAIQETMKKELPAGETGEGSQKQADINETMAGQSSLFGGTPGMPELTKMAEDSFAAVDIAGYNYLSMRYEGDGKLYPNRIICGTETFARGIDQNWRYVLNNSYIIGDFVWAGWDYLGEAGIGKIDYGENPEPGYHFYGDYPWLLAWCGDIDITGRRRPSSYYREIVFGLRKKPYIAVQRPERFGVKAIPSPWSWSDTIAGWTWTGDEGKPIRIEVYSDAGEVELLLNGTSLGKQGAGEKNRFKAEFDTVYQPGKLEAVAWSGGKEQGRCILESAARDVLPDVRVDRETINANDRDLAFVEIVLTDSQGNIWHNLRKKVSIAVEGAGELLGFGSAEPASEENYFDTVRSAFDGSVLAVIRPKGAGDIHFTVSADGCESVRRKITAV